jgi:hypothetical protein
MTTPTTPSKPKKSILAEMKLDLIAGLISGVISIIILEIFGYDIGRYGLPSWWFFPAIILFFAVRFAWDKRKRPAS